MTAAAGTPASLKIYNAVVRRRVSFWFDEISVAINGQEVKGARFRIPWWRRSVTVTWDTVLRGVE